jgi:hypothetical protein
MSLVAVGLFLEEDIFDMALAAAGVILLSCEMMMIGA